MQLFTAGNIGKLILKNRCVRSATHDNMAGRDGRVTPENIKLLTGLADGGVGLIITGYTAIRPGVAQYETTLAAHDDRYLPGLAEMARAVHQHGAALCLQLVHCGVHGKEKAGPSALPEVEGSRALRTAELAGIVADFAAAARRCREAGFDAVQLHGAHGYLLSQFLSPFYNRREDEYGGTPENRTRLGCEVIRAVRAAVGPDFPVLMKMNTQDLVRGGMEPEDAAQAGAVFAAAGLDALELSGGVILSPPRRVPVRPGFLKTPDKEGYYREAAVLFREKVQVPLVLTGGFRSLEVAEAALQDNLADFIGFSRPLVVEPHLVKRWQNGDHRRAVCLSCCRCLSRSGTLNCIHRDTLVGQQG